MVLMIEGLHKTFKIFRNMNILTKARNYELHKIGVNINQIAKRVNETDHLHSGDVEKLQEMMDAIWQSQKYILSEEP